MGNLQNLTWTIKPFDKLTATEVYQIYKLRQTVFIVEQKCIYNDFDGKDDLATHVMGKLDNQLAAYTRVFNENDYFPDYIAFGRVVTASAVRGTGIGKALIKTTLDYIDRRFPGKPCKISAQAYLERLYNSFEFEKIGEEYLEDGILHIAMVR